MISSTIITVGFNVTNLESVRSKINTHPDLDDVPPTREGSKKLNEDVVLPAAEPNDQAGVAGLSDPDVVAGVDVGVPSEGCLSLAKKMYVNKDRIKVCNRIVYSRHGMNGKSSSARRCFFAYNKNLPFVCTGALQLQRLLFRLARDQNIQSTSWPKCYTSCQHRLPAFSLRDYSPRLINRLLCQ